MRRRIPITLVSTGAVVAALVGATPEAAAAAPPHRSPPIARFVAPLPVPPVIHPDAAHHIALDAVNGTNRFAPRLPPTPTFGYVPSGTTPPAEATYLGPTIEVQRGQPVSLTVTNKLHAHPLAAYVDQHLEGVSLLDTTAPRTATHLHGGHVPSSSDGGPTQTFRRAGVDSDDLAHGSGSVTYTYPNDQEATQLWYHDHALGITRLNVVAGLAGVYLVRDAFDTGLADNPLGLPSGDYEIPLVLQDRSFHADGTFAYPTGPFAGSTAPDYPDQWAPEFFGDVATVNGRAWPTLDVDRAIYRFRLLNGSNSRFYRLSWRGPSGAPAAVRVRQIGAEGGLLDAPVAADDLLVAPGERADLLVDFRALPRGAKVTLTNDAAAPYPDGAAAPGLGGIPLRSVMQFTATGRAPDPAQPTTVPTTLRGGTGQPPALPTLTPTRTRTVLLNEILDPAPGAPTEVLINNLGFHEHVDGSTVIPRQTDIETVHLNTVEEWDIVNTTADTHPIHLHLTQFRVVGRQAVDAAAYLASYNPDLPAPSASDEGPWPIPSADDFLVPGTQTAPAANESGWKDTVQAPPGQVTRIVVPFGGLAAGVPAPFDGDAPGATQRFIGDYVFHCHILEHEDNDMMQPYRVVP
jgi:FtsP/CotA-like multicopper oxidase with cupredoxin domain